MTLVSFLVVGEAVPQGSAKAFVVDGKARITHDNAATKEWRRRVRDRAETALEGRPVLTGAVAIRLEIAFARPSTHFGKRGLRSTARPYPSVRPDLDKLERAVLDALTGVAYRDDGQVVQISASKKYLDSPGDREYVLVEIDDLTNVWDPPVPLTAETIP